MAKYLKGMISFALKPLLELLTVIIILTLRFVNGDIPMFDSFKSRPAIL